MSTLRVAVVAAVVAVLILVAGSWFLNNTRLGLEIKCRFLNDVGACFLYELTSPGTITEPPPVEDPAVAASRRAEEEANAAVAAASRALQRAVDDVAGAADSASREAADLSQPLSDLSQAVADEQAATDTLAEMIAAGSTGDFWADEVSFALYDVEFARDRVDFARDGVEFASYSIDDAKQHRQQLVHGVQDAIARLERAQQQNPTADDPLYTTVVGQRDLDLALSSIDASVAAYEDALREADGLVREAVDILDDATALAATVGAS